MEAIRCYEGWLANARKKYSELVSNARSDWEKNKQDNRIGMNVYMSWIEYWRTPEFQEKTVAARLRIQYRRDPTADELFLKTHTRSLKKKQNPIGEAEEDDEDGEFVWIDKKSEQIYASVLL
ncbi:hypothetical protein POM88_004617 [Heracleum sosnowskyi]|uniref:Uncharacterized protein n=1 Tax=Heracleum sosnowskyi TaxID=360622 RepID=A0AAD8JM08_9APIA|nr:hypothetical protein POM88_004617 [Heracleum sosnowskyi]